MISFLRGEVAARGPGWVELDVGGIGFRLTVSTNAAATLPAPGAAVRLATGLAVREDGITLFGFRDEAERDAFGALTAVAGIGPKLAVSVLSRFTPDALARAVAAEDVAALCSVSGVGRKTAQRLILELKGQYTASGAAGTTGEVTAIPASGPEEEARAALLALGYSAAQASSALSAVRATTDGEASALLRAALRQLGGAR
jgi:Holliday junction DNA helicase RuvA